MEIKKYNYNCNGGNSGSGQKISQPSFSGYDARKLTGIFVTDKTCAQALKKLCDKTQLDVFVPNIASKSIRKEQSKLIEENKFLWAQDYLTFLNYQTKAVLFDNTRDFLKRVLRATGDGIKKDLNITPFKSEPHIRGGNFFICNNNGKKDLLISENRQIYPEELAKKLFNVDNIITLPKMDYHLDLCIRPLDNGNVLVSDINMTKAGMQNGIEKIKNYIEKNNITGKEKEELENVISNLVSQLLPADRSQHLLTFSRCHSKNSFTSLCSLSRIFLEQNNINLMTEKLDITLQFDKYKPQETVNKIEKILKDSGYNPIRVPANYHYLDGVKTKEKEQTQLNNFQNNMDTLKNLSKNDSAKVRAMVDKFIELETFKKDHDKNLGVELESFYENNFINAIAYKKHDGKIGYITNASLLDKTLDITPEIEQKTGFSTKNMFIESVAPYIDKENIYFIDEKLTKNLFKSMGAIHCSAAEIPVV